MTELRNDRHLSVHDLRRRISEGDIDTVVVAFTDMQGRLQGKRMHGAYFADHVLGARHRGLQLPARRRHRHEHRRRVRHVLVGSGLRRHGVRPRSGDDPAPAARAGHGDGPVRPGVARPLTGGAVAADDPEDPVGGGRGGRVRGPGRHRTGVHRVQHLVRGGLELPLPRSCSGQPVQRRLLDPGRQPGRAVAAGDPQHDVRRRDGRRVGQGGVQLRPARDRLPVRRCLDHGRQPRRLQDRRQGDRRPARPGDHLHGQVQRARGQLLPHPPLAAR